MQIVASEVGNRNITLSSSLRELGIDSLGKLELIFKLQYDFNVDIPYNKIKKIKTIQDIVNTIKSLKSKKEIVYEKV